MLKFKFKDIPDIFLLIPASLLALLPNTIEGTFNVDFLGYDLFVFLLMGFIAFAFRPLKTKNHHGILWVIVILALLSTLLSIPDLIFAHFAIGVEFVIGYLFAERLSYNENCQNYINKIAFVILILVFVQQLSFSFNLGLFSTGQNLNNELVDGVIRAGTTVGGATFTGIFVPLLVGIIMTTTKNDYLGLAMFLLGLVSVIISGTRSAIVVLMLLGLVLLIKSKIKIHWIVKVGAIAVFIVYIYPIFVDIVSERNMETRDDLTSGRTVRWKYAFDYMNYDTSRYLTGNGGATVPISDFNNEVKALASPHNVYIGMLFEYGIFGLLLFLSFLLIKIRKLKLKFTPGRVVLIGSLLICWNSEVVPLTFLYSFFFWLLYFVEFNTLKYQSIKGAEVR